MHSRGVILRSLLPEQSRIVVFDETRGKLEGYVRSTYQTACSAGQGHILQGGFMQYAVSTRNHYFYFSDFELLTQPQLVQPQLVQPQLAHSSALRHEQALIFVHQVLEVIAVCSPACAPSDEVFQLLSILYVPELQSLIDTCFKQQLWLCKFFYIMGMHPHEQLYHQRNMIQRLILSPLEIMVKQASEEVFGGMVQQWIMGCLDTYEGGEKLRTLHVQRR